MSSSQPTDDQVDRRKHVKRIKSGTKPPPNQNIDIEKLRSYVSQLSGSSERQYDELLQQIGEAQVVLIGEGTHGTQEFYEERASITKRLIEEKGFKMVICEADVIDMDRVDRYIRGTSDASSAAVALSGFRRYPLWVFRNTAVAHFVEWARQYNENSYSKENRNGCGMSLHGCDLHGLYKSLDAVVDYLEKRDANAAKRARQCYPTFARFAPDPHEYGVEASAAGGTPSCASDVLRMVEELQDMGPAAAPHEDENEERRPHRCQDDEYFFALQNAIVVKEAEAYYRTLYESYEAAWDIRDRHMFNTLVALKDHCEAACSRPCRVVVWAHNCHVSDARATEISWDWHQINLGQLVKEKYGDQCFSIAFSTHRGSLTAAPAWGEEGRSVKLRPAMRGSQEDIFHRVLPSRFLLDASRAQPQDLELLKRSIGLVYREDSEETYNYYRVQVFQQYDRIIFIDETSAVEPLDEKAGSSPMEKTDEMPQTYPFGI